MAEHLVRSADSSTPIMTDLVWRVKISGLLEELTAEVLALTEVVLAMNEKLAARAAREALDD